MGNVFVRVESSSSSSSSSFSQPVSPFGGSTRCSNPLSLFLHVPLSLPFKRRVAATPFDVAEGWLSIPGLSLQPDFRMERRQEKCEHTSFICFFFPSSSTLAFASLCTFFISLAVFPPFRLYHLQFYLNALLLAFLAFFLSASYFLRLHHISWCSSVFSWYFHHFPSVYRLFFVFPALFASAVGACIVFLMIFYSFIWVFFVFTVFLLNFNAVSSSL